MKKTLLACLILSFIDFIYAVNDDLILEDKFPKKLSSFSFFQDSSAQFPSDGVLPYELISALFSDYSYKQRWVYIPKGVQASFRQDEVFDFPVGSALIKTFYYPIDERDLNLGQRLMETRLLLRKENGWEAVSYAWNDTQDEAFIKKAGKTILNEWIDFNGDTRSVRYRVPNKNQCKECHQRNKSIKPIGPKARNLDKDYSYEDGVMNQLDKWHKNGWIKKDIKVEAMTDWTNTLASINARSRSYLDINCGHCHIEGGSADTTGLYLDFTEERKIHLGVYKKPIAAGRASNNLKYSIVPGDPDSSILLYRMNSLDPGIMMPESGRALEHKEGTELIRKWIENL